MSVGTAVDKLAAVLDELAAVDPAVVVDAHPVIDLHRQLERLAAITTRATAAFDSVTAYETDGARTTAAWLATRCRLPVPTARRRVRLGRALRHLPIVEAAWLAGEVGEAQVNLLANVRTPATEAALAADEQLLVDEAKRLRFGSFVKVLGYWVQHVDPDGAAAADQARHGRRRFHLSHSFEGMWFADGVFDAIGGAIVADELKRIDKALFDADWAEAKARVGEGVCADDLARTPAQRRADAVVEMATPSAALQAGARRSEPLFSVIVGYEGFAKVCELADGAVVSPTSLGPWLDTAWVERVVFDGPGRVVDVGVRRRLFAGATRRAVELRDRECFHEFCDTTAAHCDIDHIQAWSAGGPTTQANGRVACGFHNRGRQRGP